MRQELCTLGPNNCLPRGQCLPPEKGGQFLFWISSVLTGKRCPALSSSWRNEPSPLFLGSYLNPTFPDTLFVQLLIPSEIECSGLTHIHPTRWLLFLHLLSVFMYYDLGLQIHPSFIENSDRAFVFCSLYFWSDVEIPHLFTFPKSLLCFST